jgi:hypothetical protein
MLSFKSFKRNISESEEKKLPFDKNANPGWHQDGDHMVVYHGTHEKNVSSMMKHGLNRPDPKTGMISVTHDPHTAHAYASMSGHGGESGFRQAGQKASTTPHNQRAVVKMRIPMHWARENMDHNLGGNVGAEDKTNDLKDAKTRMTSKDEHTRWKKNNPNKPGHVYYTGTEIRFKKSVPREFMVGHMKKYES